MIDVNVFPIFDNLYYSFYIAGLIKKRTQINLAYSSKVFPDFLPTLHSRNHFAAIFGSSPGIKVYIDASDRASLVTEGLAWCDIYAKVNVDEKNISVAHKQKIVPIGPSFGLRIWSLPQSLFLASIRYLQYKRLICQPREHFAGYWRQWRYRLPEGDFAPAKSSNGYIFFAGSLWKNEPETNTYRANFIKACSSLEDIRFEGGFAPRTKNDIQGFESLIMPRRIAFPEYLKKLKSSTVVFNTPAVAGCHGWKLGEFLALGKAIISTPLTRALPSPLQHGVHVHYVDGSIESIRQAVLTITQDRNYREALEKNAREYYLTYLEPSRVIDRLLAYETFF